MFEDKLNFDHVEPKPKPKPKPEPVPPGEYVCTAIKGQCFESSQKKTPGFKITFRICDGKFNGRLLWLDIWLTPKCWNRRCRAFAELGIGNIYDSIDTNRKFLVDVGHNEYNGIQRSVVTDFEER